MLPAYVSWITRCLSSFVYVVARKVFLRSLGAALSVRFMRVNDDVAKSSSFINIRTKIFAIAQIAITRECRNEARSHRPVT